MNYRYYLSNLNKHHNAYLPKRLIYKDFGNVLIMRQIWLFSKMLDIQGFSAYCNWNWVCAYIENGYSVGILSSNLQAQLYIF